MHKPQVSRRAWLAVTAVALLALNLRPGATSIGPVLAELRADLRMSSVAVSVLVGLPGFCFAVVGALAVKVAFRLGTVGALAAGALLGTVGALGRSLTSNPWLFLALSVVTLAGAALGNVLVPVFVKQFYPSRQALMMTVVTFLLSLGATLPGLVTPLLVDRSPGWRGTLGLWGLTGLAALPLWLWLARQEFTARRHGGPGGRRGGVFCLVRSRRAVALAVFFGVQSMQAYVSFGWLAQILRDSGASVTSASLMVSLYSGLGLPAAMVIPGLVHRTRRLRWWVVAFVVMFTVGYLGLLVAPMAVPWLWVSLTGLAGCVFPMALTLIPMRTRDPQVTARLSAFTQSIGYLFSGLGPLLMGLLYDLSGGWRIPLGLMSASAVLLLVSGLVSARPGYVDDDLGSTLPV